MATLERGNQYRKKMITLCVLDILKEQTDETHVLSSRELHAILSKSYELDVNIKTVKATLNDLLYAEVGVAYTSEAPSVREPSRMVYNDWYYEHPFTKGELRLLMDSLLFTNYIPSRQRRDLIAKLQELGGGYFKKETSHICNMSSAESTSTSVFYTAELVSEAIYTNRKIQFQFVLFDCEKNLVPTLNQDGSIKQYVLSPYQMVHKNGIYYMIGRHDHGDTLYHYRLDKIKDITILEALCRPKPADFNLKHYVEDRIYMFSGNPIPITFQTNPKMINAIIDCFGIHPVTVRNRVGDVITVALRTNEEAFVKWAIQYCQTVVVLTPETVRQKVRSALQNALAGYESSIL